MSERQPPTAQTEQIPNPGEGPRRLLRSADDRMLAGVAGGLARYFNVDPVLFRIGFVVAAFLGFGLIAYLALYIFVPLDDGWGNPVPSSGSSRLLAGAAVLALLIMLPGGLIPFSGFDWWWGLWGFMFWLAILAGAAYVLYRLVSPGEGQRMSIGRALGIVLLAFVVCCLAGVLAVTSAWATAAGGAVVIAALVIAAGLLLIGAAFFRPARWLIIPALALVLPLAAVKAAGIEIEGGYGDRYLHPMTIESIPSDGYRQAAGDLTVDLRDLDWRDDTVISLPVKMGLGRTSVIVPKRVCVSAETKIKAGAIDLRGQSEAGLGVELNQDTVPAAGPTLRLDGQVELGLLEVITHDPDAHGRDDRFGPPWRDHRIDPSPERSRQPARCLNGRPDKPGPAGGAADPQAERRAAAARSGPAGEGGLG